MRKKVQLLGTHKWCDYVSSGPSSLTATVDGFQHAGSLQPQAPPPSFSSWELSLTLGELAQLQGRAAQKCVVEEGDNTLRAEDRSWPHPLCPWVRDSEAWSPWSLSPRSTEFWLPQWWTLMNNLLPFLSLGSLSPTSLSVLPEITSQTDYLHPHLPRSDL